MKVHLSGADHAGVDAALASEDDSIGLDDFLAGNENGNEADESDDSMDVQEFVAGLL